MSIFLSYAIDDKPRIGQVLAELKSRGIVEAHDDVVVDSEVFAVGSDWRRQVRKAIEGASKFVVIWSVAAGKSEWVNYETGMAEALGKPILIVVPKGEASRLPSNLKDIQAIELEDAR